MVDKLGLGLVPSCAHGHMQWVEMIRPWVRRFGMWCLLLVLVDILVPSLKECIFKPSIELQGPWDHGVMWSKGPQVVSGTSGAHDEDTLVLERRQSLAQVIVIGSVLLGLYGELAHWNLGLWVH